MLRVPNPGGRRDNWLVEHWAQLNDVGSPLSPIRCLNVDNLTLRHVTMPVRANRYMTGVTLDNSGRVTMERCWFKGAVQLIDVRDPAPNHELVTTDCAIGIDTPGWWAAPDWA